MSELVLLETLNIVPGDSVGQIKLGDSLFNLVNKLKAANYVIKLIYSPKSPLETPITLVLKDVGIRLIFEAKLQKLILIEIVSFDNLTLFYNNFQLNPNKRKSSCDTQSLNSNHSSSSPPPPSSAPTDNKKPTLKQVYNKFFGPTYPGKFNAESNHYILSYPGISFKFDLSNFSDVLNLKRETSMDKNELLMNLLNLKNDVYCCSIALFNGNSWDEFYENLVNMMLIKTEPESSKSSNNFYYSPLIKQSPEQNDLVLHKVLINLPLGLVKLKINSGDFIIKIGETSQQEIVSVLGPPDDTFDKSDSRLLIHQHINNLNASNNDENYGKFHNYFNFGIDLLYDLNSNKYNTGILKKVIIHNGIIDSLDFMKWNKCNWSMIGYTNGSDDESINSIQSNNDDEDFFAKFNDQDYINKTANSNMYFRELPSNFITDEKLLPVLLDRTESEFIDNDLEMISHDEFEDNAEPSIMNGESASNKSLSETKDIEVKSNTGVTEEAKTWGQSKLYGCKRCIWEVVNSNGCISSITLY